MAEVKRAVRVGERLREELASLLTFDVRDPRVEGVTVTEVELSADLQLARVRVRVPGGDDPVRRDALLAGLGSASGILRREAGRKLALRYTPRLVFVYDEAPEKRQRIDVLLDEISKDPKSKDEEPK